MVRGEHITNVVLPWVRVAIMILGVTAVSLISYANHGSFLPVSSAELPPYQNALLLIVLGSSILEYKFTAPVEAAVNGLTAVVTLLTIKSSSPSSIWWVVSGYCLVVFVVATVCIAISAGRDVTGWRKRLAKITFAVATRFGRARLMFSVVFLFALFAFSTVGAREQLHLLIFWGAFLAIWPLRIPELVSWLFLRGGSPDSCGEVVRFDHPDIVRVRLRPDDNWVPNSVRILVNPDRSVRYVVPLYANFEESQLLGTGIACSAAPEQLEAAVPGQIYRSSTYGSATDSDVARLLGGNDTSRMVGFVVERSSIGVINAEVWDADSCREGTLLWCRIGESRVFYQIVEGVDDEEAMEGHRHGFQIAKATQLGTITNGRLQKFAWVPQMNTPVFAEGEDFGTNATGELSSDFCYGTIPGSGIRVTGPFLEKFVFHTAILGVTGTGKTVLAHDLIRHAIEGGVRVLAIDITAQYEERLSDLNPVMLSLEQGLVDDLGSKLFDAETGQYGAGKEKRVLKSFATQLRDDVMTRLRSFLLSQDGDDRPGLITLKEISNTKATLHITEMYLSSLFEIARESASSFPRVLVVVEEAHTVMPEANTMGIGDYESKGLVAKIAQIALQGRKYGIGLLVVAQRTATVSKTVLTQCNNIISFTTFDDTSLGFLRNTLGDQHVGLLPNLPPLFAIMHGPALRSQMPVVVSVPYETAKDHDRLYEAP